MFFAVRLERGGQWDWSRDLRKQDGWDEHARFMDSLVHEGFIILGGRLAGEREILHAVSAASEQAVRARLAQDNWHLNGMLTIKSIEPWAILLDGRGPSSRQSPGLTRARFAIRSGLVPFLRRRA